MLGISESASSSGARGTYFNTTSMSAVGDVTILGQGLNDGNDYDISFQNSTIDAGGKIVSTKEAFGSDIVLKVCLVLLYIYLYLFY